MQQIKLMIAMKYLSWQTYSQDETDVLEQIIDPKQAVLAWSKGIIDTGLG
ncbi:hypothetical protein JCM19240_2010 [Vibrio maritimus]|uniref:Uncharacterized protein n=1 Tax=Vibrio maritimus TaxID=990268 RepID=A0A090T3H5_9VIBR|nr:hypothetical protein JCM19240_2010 [Vibrio maritimus]